MCMFLHLYPARKHIQHFKVAFFRSMRYYSDLKVLPFTHVLKCHFFYLNKICKQNLVILQLTTN